MRQVEESPEAQGTTLDTILDLLRGLYMRLDAAPVRALRVEEAAKALGIERASMYELVMSGQIASIVVGKRSRRVPQEAIDAYIKRRLADEGHLELAGQIPITQQAPVARSVRARRARALSPRGRKVTS